uniref:BZIP domain-containing protein n=1 Tax=Tetraselmis sp. GSL018 TaxID=582737 RepID=A0A061RIS3_9CHLO
MQEMIQNQSSWGEQWLRRLQETTTPGDLFRETTAMEDFIQSLLKQQSAHPQVQTGVAQVSEPQGGRASGLGDFATEEFDFQPSERIEVQERNLEAPSSSDHQSQSLDDIWSKLNKPASKAQPSVAAPTQISFGPDGGKAVPSVVNECSTQLENLYSILQRLNSTVNGDAAPAAEGAAPVGVGMENQQQAFDFHHGVFGQPVCNTETASPFPGFRGPDELASAFARTSSFEVKWGPQLCSSTGSPVETSSHLEGSEAVPEPLPRPGPDEESRRKYAEQCRANRAERVRKRKAKTEATNDEDEAADPVTAKRVARAMRNRLSAQRSREKRQAYTDKLEQEVAQLKSEKQMLASQVEQMRAARAAPCLTAEQMALLEELKRQVKEFQQRESKLDLPPLKPLRRFHTMPG